jgi:large subunit ribosomal protein L10
VTLRIDDKKAIVEELAEVAARSVSVIAAEYRGLTVGQMTQLRGNARKAGSVVKIYRNTLARRAIQGTRFECLQNALVGPIILVFSKDEPAAAARMARDFAKDNPNFVVQALVLEGRLLAADQIKAVASMPSRDEALAQMMTVMKAPVVKLARTLSETYAQLVRAVSAVADKKRAAA